jgi:hypothetical protein
MLNVLSVILSLCLYTLYVLLPMLPAIKIYRLFPGDKIGVKGLLGQLTIKASGAFAAYVITTVMGFFIIQHTLCMINGISKQTWIVSAELEFQDENGNVIEENLENLEVIIKPEIHNFGSSHVTSYVPKSGDDTFLWYALGDYRPVDLKLDSENIERDPFSHKIVGKVVLRKPRVSQDKLYSPKDSSLSAVNKTAQL